jgi:hypothetical protein
VESDSPTWKIDVDHKGVEQIPADKNINGLSGCLFDLRQLRANRLFRCYSGAADVDCHIRVSNSSSGTGHGTDPGGTRLT